MEAQNKNEGNLPKRSRYHQAEMDVSSLKPGQDFNDLKPGYVIFICTFDPFGKKLYRYTFEESILILLSDYGSVPEQLAEKISHQENTETLEKWLKLAAKVSSIEEFTEKM